MKKGTIFASIILFISLFYLSIIIFQNQAIYLHMFNYKTIKKLYDQSQWQQSQNVSPLKELDKWALENKYTGWNNFVDENNKKLDINQVKANILKNIQKKGISDATLYSYVGYEYIRGVNPTLLNPEHPPLGKYLIGLSINLFHNENVILILCGLISLVLIYAIIILITQNQISASIGVGLTSTHSLFIDQLIHGPQLELFQLMFFLCVLWFLVLFEKNNSIKYLVLSGISYGLLIATKTFSTYFPLFCIWLFIVSLLVKNFKVKQYIVLQTVGIAVFTATYFKFFMLGGTLRQFLGVQKYIILFYKQSGINLVAFAGNYIRLIFTGSWKFWSVNSPFSHYSEWSILWPILFTSFLFVLYCLYRDKKKHIYPFEKILITFIILYNAFLFVIPMFPRYLLLLFIPIILVISIHSNSLLKYEKSKK